MDNHLFNIGGINEEDAQKAKGNIPAELWDRDLFYKQMQAAPKATKPLKKINHKQFKKAPDNPQAQQNARHYKEALRGKRSWGATSKSKSNVVVLKGMEALREKLEKTHKGKKLEEAWLELVLKEAKIQVWRIYQSLVFPSKVLLTNELRHALKQLTMYFIGSEHCSLDLNKGILVWGGVGTSKTTLLKTFEEFTKVNNLPTAFEFSKMENLINVAATDPKALPSHLKTLTQQNRVFDDWGVEINDKWGEGVIYINNIILARYKKRKNIKTHMTTNHSLTADNIHKLEQIYSPRVMSRLKEMVNLVGIGTGDLRN